MTDHLDIREQLAAYLAGELEGDAADRLEARMASEPWVADLADRMTDLLVDLGRVDDVDPPDGYSQRLRVAVATATGVELPAADTSAQAGGSAGPALSEGRAARAGAAAATGWSAGPTGGDPDELAERRWSRMQRGLAVAAGVVVLAVAGVGVLLGGGVQTAQDTADDGDVGFAEADGGVLADDDDAARLESADQDTAAATSADEADGGGDDTALSLPAEGATEDGRDETAQDDAAQDDAAAGEAAPGATEAAADPVPGRPAVIEVGQVDGAGLRERVGLHPAAGELLGAPADTAAELADAYRDELLRGPGWSDGTPAGVCLAGVLQDAGEGRIPAVAARARTGEAEVVAYALVRSSDGDVLDRSDVWVLDPTSCEVSQVVSAAAE